MAHQTTIIGNADAVHYLVGTTDQHGGFNAIPALQEVKRCKSLYAAKELLRDNNIHSATLVLHTPYDEMCGLPSSPMTQQTIHF